MRACRYLTGVFAAGQFKHGTDPSRNLHGPSNNEYCGGTAEIKGIPAARLPKGVRCSNTYSAVHVVMFISTSSTVQANLRMVFVTVVACVTRIVPWVV